MLDHISYFVGLLPMGWFVLDWLQEKQRVAEVDCFCGSLHVCWLSVTRPILYCNGRLH